MGGALAASDFRAEQQDAYQQHARLASEAWARHPVKHKGKFMCFFTVIAPQNRPLGRVTLELHDLKFVRNTLHAGHQCVRGELVV